MPGLAIVYALEVGTLKINPPGPYSFAASYAIPGSIGS
jgi:hypothetical protein